MSPPGPENEQRQELMSGIGELFTTELFSDFTVKCGDKKWYVHKAIICFRSSFFKAMFSNPMKESQTGIVDLSEDDPSAVEAMIRYLYFLDYPWLEYGVPSSAKKDHEKKDTLARGNAKTNLLLHSRVYSMAERMGIEGLKDLALRKLQQEAWTFFDSEELVDAAWDIYSGTVDEDRGLRDIIVRVLKTHHKLIKQDNWMAILENTKLAADVLRVLDLGSSWGISFDPKPPSTSSGGPIFSPKPASASSVGHQGLNSGKPAPVTSGWSINVKLPPANSGRVPSPLGAQPQAAPSNSGRTGGLFSTQPASASPRPLFRGPTT